MEKTILGPGIVAYKNAIKKEWNMVERLEKSLGDDSKQFKWRGARVGYFQTDNNRLKRYRHDCFPNYKN